MVAETRRGVVRAVRFEQAVYGSFPFWDRGYAVLAHSPGVRPQWLRSFQDVCQRYGEPSRRSNGSGALFAMRLDRGPWVIVGVSAQGVDDQGRPGALAFHGLFVTAREYRKASFDPFALTNVLRRDWAADTAALDPGTC